MSLLQNARIKMPACTTIMNCKTVLAESEVLLRERRPSEILLQQPTKMHSFQDTAVATICRCAMPEA
jgi:hypothetical protein